jgi:Ni/Co efflux regulator RcnB
MNTYKSAVSIALAAALAISIAPGTALAKNNGKGHGKGHDKAAERAADVRMFRDEDRIAVRDWSDSEFRNGRCPPGLAKKRNGCMPPGQAKKYDVGSTLPRNVRTYDVPRSLTERFGPAPAGYRYVRVNGDILLVADGTRRVQDTIINLGRG